jgi:hypothetical protein
VIIDDLGLTKDGIEGSIVVANGDRLIYAPEYAIFIDSTGRSGIRIFGGEEDAKRALENFVDSDFED